MDENRMLISIIVPVYQVQAYLPACLDSVLAQTYPAWELLAVDDGSIDGSGAVCDAYAKLDSRIHVIHQSNQGVSAARNRGVALAKGGCIAFVDADDRIAPDYLDRLAADLTAHEADMVCCNAFEETGQARSDYRCVLHSRVIRDRETLFRDALIREEQYGFTVWGKLIRTELVRQIPFPAQRFGEDTYFMLCLFQHVSTVVLDSYPGYVYARQEGSAMLQTGRHDLSRCMGQLASAQLLFRLTRDMSRSTRELAARHYAAYLHAAAAAAALAGGACFHEQRGRLGESVTELKQDWKCLGFSDRVKLLLIERFPIAYRGCIRLLQLLGRT